MKLTKDSKIVRLSGYACGYHSGAETNGEIWMSKEFYDEHKEIVDEFEYFVCGLDGKHSECEMSIEIEEFSLFDYFKVSGDESECMIENLLDKLYQNENYKAISEEFDSFQEALSKLPKTYEAKEYSTYLDRDITTNETLIPKGTILNYTITTEFNIEEDLCLEY